MCILFCELVRLPILPLSNEMILRVRYKEATLCLHAIRYKEATHVYLVNMKYKTCRMCCLCCTRSDVFSYSKYHVIPCLDYIGQNKHYCIEAALNCVWEVYGRPLVFVNSNVLLRGLSKMELVDGQ